MNRLETHFDPGYPFFMEFRECQNTEKVLPLNSIKGLVDVNLESHFPYFPFALAPHMIHYL